MRKAIAAGFALLLAGILPAGTTMIGFCAALPCCAPSAEAALRAESADCCDEIACADSPVQDLGFSSAKSGLKDLTAVVAPVPAVLVTPLLAAQRHDDLAPPRSSQQRLSTLSVLLI